MSTTRRLIRTVVVVSLAAAAAGCIVVPRDPWGGHGGHGRRGGHHLDQPQPQQAPVSEPGHRRPDGGRR